MHLTPPDSQDGQNAFEEDIHCDGELSLVLQAIKDCCGQDFSGYSPASMKRLVDNLVFDEQLQYPSQLIPELYHGGSLKKRVIDKLTVSYSQLFRDPALFIQLKEEVFPVLASYPRFSIWVAGCATGEEVFSLVITLQEAGLLEKSQIYASDISPLALRIASLGKLKSAITAEDEARYQASGGSASLSEYFSDELEPHLDPKLLERVSFQSHDLAGQPSFLSAQLVMCRNVFIYFNRYLQCEVLSLLLKSMTSRGYLAIGTEESIEACTEKESLELVSRKAGLYRKRPALQRFELEP